MLKKSPSGVNQRTMNGDQVWQFNKNGCSINNDQVKHNWICEFGEKLLLRASGSDHDPLYGLKKKKKMRSERRV